MEGQEGRTSTEIHSAVLKVRGKVRFAASLLQPRSPIKSECPKNAEEKAVRPILTLGLLGDLVDGVSQVSHVVGCHPSNGDAAILGHVDRELLDYPLHLESKAANLKNVST